MASSVSQTVVVRLKNTHERLDVDSESSDERGISARLRAARKKMRLNQGDFAKLAGVHINTQGKYEGGLEPPLDYFLRLGDAGVDWYWIVTGNRIEGESLPDGAANLVLVYRTLPPAFQAILLRHAQDLSDGLALSSSSNG